MSALRFFRWMVFFPALSAGATANAQSEPIHISHMSPAVREQLAMPGVRVAVFFFALTDCPISNRYVTEIERLDREYAGRGVRVWWVYPSPTDNPAVIAQHRKDFAIQGAVYPDAPGTAVQMAHVTVTPEAAVFVVESGELREVYHGRIDDRYVALGQERPQATRHELEMAIAAALEGRAAPAPNGPPVGCAIVPAEK